MYGPPAVGLTICSQIDRGVVGVFQAASKPAGPNPSNQHPTHEPRQRREVVLLFVREPVEVEHHHRRAAMALAMLRRCLRDCRSLLSGHHLLKNWLAEGSLFRVQVRKKDAPHLHGGLRQGLLGFSGSKGSAPRFKLPKTKEQFLVVRFPLRDVRKLLRHGRPLARCPERRKDDLFLTVVMGMEKFREAPREFGKVQAVAFRNRVCRHPDDCFQAPSERSMH